MCLDSVQFEAYQQYNPSSSFLIAVLLIAHAKIKGSQPLAHNREEGEKEKQRQYSGEDTKEEEDGGQDAVNWKEWPCYWGVNGKSGKFGVILGMEV